MTRRKLWVPSSAPAICSFILRFSARVFNFLLKDDPRLRGTTPKGILSEHVHHRSQNLRTSPLLHFSCTATGHARFFRNILSVALFRFSSPDYPRLPTPFLSRRSQSCQPKKRRWRLLLRALAQLVLLVFFCRRIFFTRSVNFYFSRNPSFSLPWNTARNFSRKCF